MNKIDLHIQNATEEINKATNLALLEVVRIARLELEKNKELKKFTMAMGTYFFSYENENTNGHECKELDDFIYKYSELKLTGEPITFTTTGDIITDW